MLNIKKNVSFFLIFTIIYLFLEITFNIGLVDFINSKNTEISTFNKLETLGRVLSSLGLSLFLVNALKVRKIALKALSLLMLMFVFYNAQNIIFNKIVDGLPNKTKLNAYAFGVYRNIYLNNSDQKGNFSNVFTAPDKGYNEVSNAMIGTLLYNDKINNQVDSYVKDFFKIKVSLNSDELGQIYDKLSSVSGDGNFDNLWNRYFIESKKYNNYTGLFKSEYHKRFVESIGMEPNLPKNQFIASLKAKDPNFEKIQNITIVPANKKIGMAPLYLKDIPSNLNKKQWISYVQNYIQKSLDKVCFNETNVNNLPHSKSIISSVIIVPIAIFLSFISIILNIGVVLSSFIKKSGFAWFGIVIVAFIYLMNVSNYYNLPMLMNGFIHLEKDYITLLSPYRKVVHSSFVNDKNPNREDIIVITKPVIPDISESYTALEQKFENLSKTSSSFQAQKNNSDMKIDENKLNDRGYYGEVNKKNPYTQN